MLCVAHYERILVSWAVFLTLDVWADGLDYVEVDRRRRNCLQEASC